MRYVMTFVLLILMILPSFYLYSKNSDSNIFLMSIAIVIYIYALIKDSRYLLAFYPLVIIVPFILFYTHYYDNSINEQILSIVLETNWQEARSFLGAKVYLYMGLFSLWLVMVTVLFWKNNRTPVVWSHRSRWWIIVAISSIGIIGLVANQVLATDIDSNFLENDSFLVDEKNSLLQDLKQTYPLGLFISLTNLYQEQAKINTASTKHEQFSFNVKPSNTVNNKQLVVLVIGETSRRANWQLNGYVKHTNPLLSTQVNVVNFTDMLSVANATRSSIPMLLTRKPAERVNNYDFAEKSVISAFKEAGFDSYWISTQQKFGAHDTSTSVYAKEADNIIFLNKTNYNNQGETDEVVLPIFNKILDSQSQKTFVIIHTLGSHFDYSHRYPPSFDKFKPSLNDVNGYSVQDKKYKQQLINSYDNSILYTDYVLNEVIESMKKQEQTESFLLYSSDHGEDFFDGQCNKSGHGNQTPYNFEIASLAWYSSLFAASHADKVQQLQANATKPVNHTSIFPTLIDAADITIPDYSLNRSLLGRLDTYPRLVLGGIDYDNNTQQGSCREMK